jgi:hypothetical protein
MAALIAIVAVCLHRIRVWFYFNYLTKIKGKYITWTEAMFTIEEIAGSGAYIDEFIDVETA